MNDRVIGNLSISASQTNDYPCGEPGVALRHRNIGGGR